MADPYNLKRRGKKGYYVPDFMLYGVRVHRSTKCVAKPEAIQRCEEWVREIKDRAEGRTPPAAPPLTLRELWARWSHIRKPEVAASHWRDMRVAVEVHAAKYLDLPIPELTSVVMNEIRSDYLQSLGVGFQRGGGHTARKHTKGGANQMVKQLRALCSWGVDAGLLTALPFKLKRLKPDPKEKSVLWREQMAPFLAQVDRLAHRRHQPLKPVHLAGGTALRKRRQTFAHSATACRLMAQAGLREDETRTLEWPNIDWRNRALIITSAETLDGEGRPKDRETRVVGIPPALFGHLRLVWEEHGKPSQGLVLVSTKSKGPGPHSVGFTARVIESAGLAIGVPGLTPHALRRAFATGHWEIGTSLKKIAEMLGHGDPETTRKHYIVERAQDHTEAQSDLEKAMGLAPEPAPSSPPKVTQKTKEPAI